MSDYERIQVDTDLSSDNPIDNAMDGLPGISAMQGVNQIADASGTIWDMVNGDTGAAEGLTDIALGAASLGSQAGAFIADPIATLAAWGLDILLSLVTPLQDALDWVTGSPGDMEDAAEMWKRIAQADVDLSQAVVDNMQPLSNWAGQDGAAAALKTDLTAAGFYGAGKLANDIAGCLATAQIMADTIQSVVKFLISLLIKYFITEIAPMILASPATFGASAATGVAWASVRAAQTATNVASKISQMTGLFGRLMGVLAKIGSSNTAVVAIDALRNSVPDAIGMSQDAEGSFHSIRPAQGPTLSLSVDPEKIAEAAPVFKQIAEDAAGVAEVVSSTAKDDLTWGITGWFFAGDYNRQVEDLKQLMSDAKSTLQILATNIERACEDWEGADAEIEQIFKGIELVIVVEQPGPGC
jgi:hypothetical protein